MHRVGQKKEAVMLRVVTLSVMDQFKEIPLLESLVNFQKDACNICHIAYLQNVTTLPCKMSDNVRVHLEFCKSQGQTQ